MPRNPGRKSKPTHRFKPGHVSLERALSKLGLASRTTARAWIEAGRVKVDGRVRRDPLSAVVPESAQIEIEGALAAKAEFLCLLLHKPKGVVTTHSDEEGRPTVFSLLPQGTPHLIAVGRLDAATSGVLLLTNDTRLSSWLTDPVNRVPRVYVVTVRGEITEEKLARLREGVVDRGEELSPDAVVLRKSSGKESHLTVRLTEGKNREIRRLFAAVGNEVTRLKRVSFGGVELGDLAPGQFVEIGKQDLYTLFKYSPEPA